MSNDIDIDALAGELRSPERVRRRAAEDALVGVGAPAVRHVLALAEPVDGNPGYLGVQPVLERLGEQAIAPLQRIRRHGPGGLRRAALRALADLGGGDVLDDKDIRAVERLVSVKLTDEEEPDLPIGRWLAVPHAKVEDIVEALGLHDPRPVTVAMGLAAAVETQNSVEYQDPEGGTATGYRVFITPEFDGWRLVYGDDFINDRWADAVQRPSTRCREAHFYLVDDFDGVRIWWVAQNGHDRRGYSTYGDPQWIGEPMQFERSLMSDPDDLFEDSEDYSEGVTDPENVASWISIPPTAVSVAERTGHGHLAVTDPRTGHGRFKGALTV
jgi:hypothetical protein